MQILICSESFCEDSQLHVGASSPKHPVHNYIISPWLGPAVAMELLALLSYLYSVHSWTRKTQVFLLLIAKFKSEFQDYTQGHHAHEPNAARGLHGSQINGEISVQTR
jgi:hypothetical protein